MQSLKELYRIGSGPSSSHTMGPEIASNVIKNENLDADEFNVTLYGSLALTGKGHFTNDIILKVLGKNRTTITNNLYEKIDHPNTFKVEVLKNKIVVNKYIVESIGGGEVLINHKRLNQSKDLYPFKNFKEIREYARDNNMSLEDVVYKFDEDDIKDYLNNCYNIMIESIENGLTKDGFLPGSLKVKRKAKSIYLANDASIDNRVKFISSYAYAISEENASMGRIVTAPTCGACGVLPSCLYYLEKTRGYSRERIINALAVAGLIGNTIKQNASISGAFGGCQAEIGSACSMASAAICYLEGDSFEKIDSAAEIAMEHHLGLTCDPVDGLVQIPCIERNAVAALRAFDAAKLSRLPIYPERINFDMVVETMLDTGKDINEAYKETSLGGLAKNKIYGD